MYHHVNRHPEDSITISPERFESHIKFLKCQGYTSLFLPEMFEIMYGRVKAPKKPVLMAFDDGYLDNWAYAFPILKKYSFKATIFVITRLIKDATKTRTNIDDVWAGKIIEEGLPNIPPHFKTRQDSIAAKEGLPDFLTWQEMRVMEKTGLLDIQSHSHTHSAYFDSDKVQSFNDGTSSKLASATDGDARLGIPVYKMAPALVARRYFDDEGLRDHLAAYVDKRDSKRYLKSADRKPELMAVARNYIKAKGLKGRFETEEEQTQRTRSELVVSKELIEKKLGKRCEYICWPWGSVDRKLIRAARGVGYKGGVGMRGGANFVLTNPFDIHRFNGCQKDMASFRQKLFKQSSLFLSLYNDDRIDALLMPKSRFKPEG